MTTDSYESSFAELLLELMPCALLMIDEQQMIVHVNTQTERLFQESASNILGQHLDVMLPQELIQDHRRYVQNFVQSKERVRNLEDQNVLSACRSTGESFSFLGTIAKLNLPEGFRLAIIMHEVKDYLRSEHLRQRMERALYCLSQCLSAVIQASEEKALLEEVCHIVVNTGGYRFAWIGFAEEDDKKSIGPMAAAGQDDGYLQEVFVSWSEDDPSGLGPVGRAIRTGQPQFSRNIERDQDFSPWREPALRRGFYSVAAFPLRLKRRVYGSLTLYSTEDTFDQEEIDLLAKLADNLSYGLTALRTKKERDEQQVLVQRKTHLLQERVKELNLLYTISRLKSRDDISPADILTQITAAIPRAWQFPDIAQARIQVSGYGDFQTPGYSSSSLSLAHSIVQDGQKMGRVEVVYTQDPQDESDEAFLPEEDKLVQSIAHHVADIIRNFNIVADKRKLSGALEQTADTVVITDREGTIEYVNPSFESSTGFSRQEAVGQKPNILKSGEHPPEFYQNMWETILRGEVYRDTVINRTKNGSLYYEYKTITPLYDQQDRLTHFLATGKDLTEQLQTESRLQYLTSHDPITGLMNHKEFVRELDQTIADLSNKNKHLAVVVFGLDSFKAINELLGRSTGDRILRQAGQRLAHNANAAVARLESDKFGLVIKSRAPQQTGVLVDTFLNALARPLRLDTITKDVVITATAGISCYPADGNQGMSLVQKADTAMSRAKESGIQRFDFYTPDMQASSLERLRLNKELLDALEQTQFTLHFQPQIDVLTNRVTGAEALVRWLHPRGQLVGPQEFIPVLEEMGRIGELGDFVLDQACATLQCIQKAGLVLPQMSINLAAPQLEDPALGSKIAEALKTADIPPDRLEMEVTESLLISRYEKVQDCLTELLDMGIGVALDDFGTGYSSLQYLTRYPFTKVKIDKSFVWNMALGNKDFEVVKAIISLGRSLKIKVLAEGVETEEHVRSLRNLGCETVQGYLYSPPLDEQAFMTYLDGAAKSNPTKP
ncbi:MAG: EAL domain-containing protein [Desulfohalobiaceae bacterium]|nr:EAL domain-containing protein [Desulfohalobiaceae bacterium]